MFLLQRFHHISECKQFMLIMINNPNLSEYIESWFTLRNGDQSILPHIRKYIEDEIARDKKIFFYELHNAKMHFFMTKHSQWIRKYHPFLRCKCLRGEAITNDNIHSCEIMDDATVLSFYNRSLNRWDSKSSRDPTRYDKDKHCDWCDLLWYLIWNTSLVTNSIWHVKNNNNLHLSSIVRMAYCLWGNAPAEATPNFTTFVTM